MQDKKNGLHEKNIVQALGVFLILCCAVLFLAPAGNLWPLAMASISSSAKSAIG
jgi:hypothetical protein